MKRVTTYREHVTLYLERTDEARAKASESIPWQDGWEVHCQGPTKGGYKIRASREIEKGKLDS